MMTNPIPGWYPDPVIPSVMRYWDGQAWTGYTSPATEAVDQVPPAANGTVTQPPQESAATAPVGQQPSQKNDIPRLGARARARELSAENQALRELLQQVGALTLAETQLLVAEAEAKLEQTQLETKKTEERARAKTERLEAKAQAQVTKLNAEAAALRAQILDLRRTVSVQDVALYDYENPAEHSATLGAELAALRMQIKAMVASKAATTADQNFTFNNSRSKGRAFVASLSRLMLTAYNSEAENCIKSVKAGGLETAIKRLERTAEQVHTHGRMINLRISPEYHQLRVLELSLTAQHRQAVAAEREYERERRAEIRENERAERELQRERERLEKEQAHYLSVVAKLTAKGDSDGAARAQERLDAINAAIADVDYRAANVRAGYVYVISNIGSFGERMVKIGMTRRLEPMDRVRELGDASVPFRFDVHALFFSADAYGVEAMLHRELADRRVNRINTRREFFYCTPDDVLGLLKEHQVAVVEFNLDAEAEEYRLSQRVAEKQGQSARPTR